MKGSSNMILRLSEGSKGFDSLGREGQPNGLPQTIFFSLAGGDYNFLAIISNKSDTD